MENFIIGICDDEILVIQQLEKIVRRILDERNAVYEIRMFISGEELISDINKLQAVFLDIEMPKFDGIEIGKLIKKNNPNCKIIMATAREERIKEAFQIEALRFISKPFDLSEVEDAIMALYKNRLGIDSIEFYNNRNVYLIKQSEIQYIRAYDGYLECKYNNKLFRREESLKRIYDKLDKRLFVRVNRSYIINVSFITKYDDNFVVLSNESIKIARRERKNFEYVLLNYDLKYR